MIVDLPLLSAQNVRTSASNRFPIRLAVRAAHNVLPRPSDLALW